MGNFINWSNFEQDLIDRRNKIDKSFEVDLIKGNKFNHKYIRKENGRYIYEEPKQKTNIYEKIKYYAKQVIEGGRRIERLSQREEQGRIKGGRRNVECAVLIGTIEGSNKYDFRKGVSDAEKQEIVLEKYAKEEGFWVDYFGQKKYWDFMGSGLEADVFRVDDHTVKKVVQYDMNHDTPLEYLDRLALHNYLFPEAPYKLTGITRSRFGLCFIVEQPIIKNVLPADSKEVSKYMKQAGFKDMGSNLYINKSYIDGDLHSGNVLTDKEGNLIFIDPVIKLNTTEEKLGGNREFGKIQIK